MAQGPVIQLPISGEACRIGNVFPADLCRMGRLVLHMLVPVAVARFARNPQLIIARVPKRATVLLELEGGAVTFQTSGDNDSCKVYLTIGIAWTVYPLIDSGQIGHGQFEQQAVPPVEIGLPSSAGPDHQIDPLRPCSRLGRVHAGLVERTFALLHLEVDPLRPGAQQVVSLSKASLNGPGRCLSGSLEVSGLSEGIEYRLVAGFTRYGVHGDDPLSERSRDGGGQETDRSTGACDGVRDGALGVHWWSLRCVHARGESRTHTGLPPGDFESPASAIPPLGRVLREPNLSRRAAAPHMSPRGVSRITALVLSGPRSYTGRAAR